MWDNTWVNGLLEVTHDPLRIRRADNTAPSTLAGNRFNRGTQHSTAALLSYGICKSNGRGTETVIAAMIATVGVREQQITATGGSVVQQRDQSTAKDIH